MSESSIADLLEKDLPKMINKIAKKNKISEYIADFDFLDERLKKWHQFGLFTHSKKVREAFRREIPKLLEEWRIYEHTLNYFLGKIDNIEKGNLFEVSIPLHDLGKIIVYGNRRKDREHEKYSKEILYSEDLKEELHFLKLSDFHIDYIGKCIETHDVIGKKVRDLMKERGILSMNFVSNKEILGLFEKISKEYCSVKNEIGIFYLCDSLGKIDIRINAENDFDILKKEKEILGTLKKRNLSLELISAVKQLPINIKLAEVYLKQLFKDDHKDYII